MKRDWTRQAACLAVFLLALALAAWALLGLTRAEYEAMDPEELVQRKQKAAERYTEAGADLVIDSIRDLPAALAELERRMAEQEAAR